MKAPKVFAVVLVAHLLAFSLLFVQQGCQTMSPEERVDRTRPSGPADAQLARAEYQPAAAPERTAQESPQRAAPARPDDSWGDPLTPDDDDLFAPVDDESPLSPLPRDDEPLDDWEWDWDDIPEEEEPVGTGTYIVQSGDNIWNIARRENVSMDELLAINNLTRESIIRPGQELRIPAGTGGRPSAPPATSPPPRQPVEIPEGAESYTVRSGDSLSVIAQRYGTTVSELRSVNNLEGDTIRIGQELVLPDGDSAPREQPATSAAPDDDVDGLRYTVVSGDTLGAIASRYGVSVSEIMQVNDIRDERTLRIGQTLVIPGVEEEEDVAEEEPRPVEEALPVVPDEPVEMDFIEDEDDEDVPLIPIIPDDE